MNRLKRLFLYADTEKEDFLNIKAELRESSRMNLAAFTSIAAAAMLVMFFSSFFSDGLAPNRTAYGCSFLACLALFATARTARRHPRLVYIGVYAFIALLFAFGIALGTFIEPNQMTVSFVILLFVAPLLFTDIPLRMCIAILLGMIAYTPAARMTQSDTMFNKNMVDIGMYGTLSMVVSTYMMMIKVRRIHLEQENLYLSEWDQLTELKNRRCFENDLHRMQTDSSRSSLLCAFDVNGLKAVNDQFGHAAGDELLQGAAHCIQEVFGPYGTCYRTGGDEFIAILTGKNPNIGQLAAAFEEATQRWNGKLVHHLSVAVGMIPVTAGAKPEDLVTAADFAMYEKKKEYYQSLNH